RCGTQLLGNGSLVSCEFKERHHFTRDETDVLSVCPYNHHTVNQFGEIRTHGLNSSFECYKELQILAGTTTNATQDSRGVTLVSTGGKPFVWKHAVFPAPEDQRATTARQGRRAGQYSRIRLRYRILYRGAGGQNGPFNGDGPVAGYLEAAELSRAANPRTV